jgi:hypothetical protein
VIRRDGELARACELAFGLMECLCQVDYPAQPVVFLAEGGKLCRIASDDRVGEKPLDFL